MPSFANPVSGIILPVGSPSSPPQFRVTKDCAGHKKLGQGCALDLGNARSGDPVLSQAVGTVIFAGPLPMHNPPALGDGSLTVRIDYGGGWEGGYSHLSKITVVKGQKVGVGQHTGNVGATGYGITAAHLHFHLKLNTVPQDPWPLLRQNQQEPDMNTTIQMYPTGMRRTWRTKGGALTGYRLNPPPLTKTGNYAAGSPAHSDAEYQITPTPAGWPAGPYQRVIDGGMVGYLLANSQIDLDPVPVCPPAGGFTQEDVNEARKEGAEAAAEAAQKTADALP